MNRFVVVEASVGYEGVDHYEIIDTTTGEQYNDLLQYFNREDAEVACDNLNMTE